jgi:hypothetical protein
MNHLPPCPSAVNVVLGKDMTASVNDTGGRFAAGVDLSTTSVVNLPPASFNEL